MSSNSNLTLLAPLVTAQLDGLAVVLKDAAVRLETIKAAAAQAAERETDRIEQPVERSSEPASEPKDDPDRVVTLAEASHLSSFCDHRRQQQSGPDVRTRAAPKTEPRWQARK